MAEHHEQTCDHGDHEDRRVIVIAMDESPRAAYALQFYKDHIHKPDDRIVLVHCPEYQSISQLPAIPTDAGILAEIIAAEEKRVRELLEHLGNKMRQLHLGGKVKSMSGKPGEAIVKAAHDMNATMIVTGSRGMGTIRRTLLGSVSDYVLHHSNIPVLICRHDDD